MNRFCRIAIISLGVLLMFGRGLSLMAQAPPRRVHDPSKAEVLTLPLLPEGFSSGEVTIEGGLYWIHVLNRTSVRGLRIEIDRMAGTSVQGVPERHEADGPEDTVHRRFLKPVTLTRGTYRVLITGHPSWVCAINVK